MDHLCDEVQMDFGDSSVWHGNSYGTNANGGQARGLTCLLVLHVLVQLLAQHVDDQLIGVDQAGVTAREE